jgi:hypothetical protein
MKKKTYFATNKIIDYTYLGKIDATPYECPNGALTPDMRATSSFY